MSTDQTSHHYQNHPAYQIARDVLNLLTMMFAFYAANLSARNHTKIEEVESKQGEAAVKQDVAAVRAESVKIRLEERAADEARMMGVQLYSTWKYLEDVALQSGSARDKTKAGEAKQAYEDHVRKYAKP